MVNHVGRFINGFFLVNLYWENWMFFFRGEISRRNKPPFQIGVPCEKLIDAVYLEILAYLLCQWKVKLQFGSLSEK